MASDDKNVEALGEVVETARGIIAGYRTDNTDLRAQLTAALARAEKAEKERDALRGVVVTVDTPNEVCDGTYAATLGTIIDAYGTEALGWLTNQECDWKQRAEKAEAEATKWRGLYEKATDALDGWKRADTCDPMVRGECVREARERTDAHDAARKEAGL